MFAYDLTPGDIITHRDGAPITPITVTRVIVRTPSPDNPCATVYGITQGDIVPRMVWTRYGNANLTVTR